MEDLICLLATVRTLKETRIAIIDQILSALEYIERGKVERPLLLERERELYNIHFCGGRYKNINMIS